MTRPTPRLCAAVFALVALAACEGDKVTQLVISVATDMAIPKEVDQLVFIARYRDANDDAVNIVWDLDANRPDAITMPARIAVLPSSRSALSRVVQLEVRALVGGKRVLERRAALPFARDRALLLGMNLLRRCIPVRCQPDESCGEGGCEKIDKNPDELPDWNAQNEKKSQDARASETFVVPGDGGDGGDGPGDGPSDGAGDGDGDGPSDGPRDGDGDGDGDGGDGGGAGDGDGPTGDTTSDAPPPDGPKDSTVDTTKDSGPSDSSVDTTKDGTPADSTSDSGGGGTLYNTTCNVEVPGTSSVNADRFAVGVAPNGDAIALWLDFASGFKQSDYDGIGWTSRPGNTPGPTIFEGDVAVSDNGDVHGLWQSFASQPNYEYRRSSGAWTSVGSFGTPTTLMAFPRVAPVVGSSGVVLGAVEQSATRVVHHVTANLQGNVYVLGAEATLSVSADSNFGIAASASASVSTTSSAGATPALLQGRSSLTNTTLFPGGTVNIAGSSGLPALALNGSALSVFGFDAAGTLWWNPLGLSLSTFSPAAPGSIKQTQNATGSLSAFFDGNSPVVFWQEKQGAIQTLWVARNNLGWVSSVVVSGPSSIAAKRTRVVHRGSGNAYVIHEINGKLRLLCLTRK